MKRKLDSNIGGCKKRLKFDKEKTIYSIVGERNREFISNNSCVVKRIKNAMQTLADNKDSGNCYKHINFIYYRGFSIFRSLLDISFPVPDLMTIKQYLFGLDAFGGGGGKISDYILLVVPCTRLGRSGGMSPRILDLCALRQLLVQSEANIAS